MDNDQNEDVIEVKPEGEVMQKEYEFIPAGLCRWRQRGIYVVCTSCELQHAVYIGIDRMMIGEKEDGSPLLVSRSEYEQNGYKKTK